MKIWNYSSHYAKISAYADSSTLSFVTTQAEHTARSENFLIHGICGTFPTSMEFGTGFAMSVHREERNCGESS